MHWLNKIPYFTVSLFLAAWLVLAATSAQASVKIEGVSFASQLNTSPTLQLQGYGLLRYRWVIKAYVAAFYQTDTSLAAEDMSGGKHLEIEYFHAIKAGGFAKATRDGVRSNTDQATYAAIEADLEAFLELYQDVQPGDRYALTWFPDQGISLNLNGEALGRFSDERLARALFAIWLGENPGDERLKQALLGG
ncbi:chalcone isomerase family protein [Marinospirillum alkaliphilum]|uniref:Chalcone isomerase-like n=1 Tax=Marinospirillum alkaliphilum DSM 21637 TaxID=1122209 RepID=A0A1K1Y5D6_9GAMM|nr:chalcone isomerase family protein [Marinospirillum alkaliphilum]SFX56795.1 Chalcone isomerase-like [Marinospirillum alkaliphilum DSM 21637]